MNSNNIVMWETQHSNVDWDYFKIPVSHSPTEAEIISLDAGPRMDGIPALDLRNLLIEVFHCDQKTNPIKTKGPSAQGNLWHRVMTSTRKKSQTKTSTVRDSSELFHIDNVPSNVRLSRSMAMLYVFEDNEAVIDMIIKGRSPTMRHVSRTHRVSLDGLFDRINLDPKIRIRYIDTKHQIADILTEGHFIRDEWHNLLCLFNISHFSFLCCAKNFQLDLLHHRKDQSEENRIVAKSRPSAMNLTSSVAASSSSVNSPIAWRSPGILKASSGQVGLSGRLDANANQNSNPDAASSSQGWQRDAQMFFSTGKLVAMVTTEHQGCSGKSKIPKDSGDSKPESRVWRHHFHVSPSIVRKTCDQKPTEDLKVLDVNTTIWGVFMSVTLHAAVHLGQDCSMNLRSVKNQSSKSVDQLFWTTERLIKEQTETTGVSTINSDQRMWRESSLLSDGAVRIVNSKNYVFSDSVLCL